MKEDSRFQNRLLHIPGAKNFRDLGGYPTLSGRKVKWGVLYRSGHLANLTSRGVKKIEALGLSKIIDFRSDFETSRRPDREIEGPQRIYLPVMDQATKEFSQEIRRRIENREYEGYYPVLLMQDAYRSFADQYTPEFRSFIQAVLDADGAPVLWHCTSGKDRTGFSAAILLRILGVDEETINRDYLLSNRYGDNNYLLIARIILARGRKAYQMIKPMMGVNPSWLNAAFAAIDEKWGDFDAYLRDGLNLDHDQIILLRTLLLE
jgi:protein-tyrosine phosphatase